MYPRHLLFPETLVKQVTPGRRALKKQQSLHYLSQFWDWSSVRRFLGLCKWQSGLESASSSSDWDLSGGLGSCTRVSRRSPRPPPFKRREHGRLLYQEGGSLSGVEGVGWASLGATVRHTYSGQAKCPWSRHCPPGRWP